MFGTVQVDYHSLKRAHKRDYYPLGLLWTFVGTGWLSFVDHLPM